MSHHVTVFLLGPWMVILSYYFLFGDLFTHILLTSGNVIVGDNNEIMDNKQMFFIVG